MNYNEEFERNIDSFYGKQEYIHSRTCTLDNLTIHPNGDVATCIFKYDKPIYNLVTKEQKMDLNEIYKEEKDSWERGRIWFKQTRYERKDEKSEFKPTKEYEMYVDIFNKV